MPWERQKVVNKSTKGPLLLLSMGVQSFRNSFEGSTLFIQLTYLDLNYLLWDMVLP